MYIPQNYSYPPSAFKELCYKSLGVSMEMSTTGTNKHTGFKHTLSSCTVIVKNINIYICN